MPAHLNKNYIKRQEARINAQRSECELHYHSLPDVAKVAARAVAKEYQEEPWRMFAQTRYLPVVAMRQVLSYLLYHECSMSFAYVGELVRTLPQDHSTIINSCTRVHYDSRTDAVVAAAIARGRREIRAHYTQGKTGLQIIGPMLMRQAVGVG